MTTKIKKSNLDTDVFGSIGTHLIPDTNVTYDLGSPEYKFRDLYLSSATIHLGDLRLSTANGALEILDASGTAIPPADTYDTSSVDAMVDDIIGQIEDLASNV